MGDMGFLASCNDKKEPDIPETSPTETTVPTQQPTIIPSPSDKAYLSVVRGQDIESVVKTSIDALGGMERFVEKGNDVIIKPNICVAHYTYEYAATTNPEVVGTLVGLCMAAGAGRVRVMDFPFAGTAE